MTSASTAVARLTGHGRRTWRQALPLLDGCACTWSDLDGIHLTPGPPSAPPAGATHLWGWADGRCVRLRFDHDAVYAAVLHAGSDLECAADKTVTPTVHRPVTWSPDDRAGPLPAEIEEQTWELLEIPGPAPVTFVRAITSNAP